MPDIIIGPPLTEEEYNIFEVLEETGPIPEPDLHKLIYAASQLGGGGYKFEDINWTERGYKDGGIGPFSGELDKVIKSLVEKGYVKREKGEIFVELGFVENLDTE